MYKRQGALQTLQQRQSMLPADLVIGMKVTEFDQGAQSSKIDLVLVNAQGQPLAHHPFTVEASQEIYYACLLYTSGKITCRITW